MQDEEKDGIREGTKVKNSVEEPKDAEQCGLCQNQETHRRNCGRTPAGHEEIHGGKPEAEEETYWRRSALRRSPVVSGGGEAVALRRRVAWHRGVEVRLLEACSGLRRAFAEAERGRGDLRLAVSIYSGAREAVIRIDRGTVSARCGGKGRSKGHTIYLCRLLPSKPE